MTYYYSPFTGEHIATSTPADWMSRTDLVPPTFDAATQGLLFTNGAWVVTTTPVDLQALQDQITQATQAWLDDWARSRNYDGILSACTYAASAVPQFATEGRAAVRVRDQTWGALYTLMQQVQTGQAPMPMSFADVLPLLPVPNWS